MPKYPGKKPTFFVESTTQTTADIRMVNQAMFLIKQGYGVTDVNTVMGSIWCEMTIKFYDPVVQQFVGSEDSYSLIDIGDNNRLILNNVGLPLDNTISQCFDPAGVIFDNDPLGSGPAVITLSGSAAETNNCGTEFVKNVNGTGISGWYIPPGVWNIKMIIGCLQNFDTTYQCAINPQIYNETLGTFTDITKDTNLYHYGTLLSSAITSNFVPLNKLCGLTASNPATKLGASTASGTGPSTSAPLQWPAEAVGSSFRLIVPNDGQDWYFSYFCQQAGTATGNVDLSTSMPGTDSFVTAQVVITLSHPTSAETAWMESNIRLSEQVESKYMKELTEIKRIIGEMKADNDGVIVESTDAKTTDLKTVYVNEHVLGKYDPVFTKKLIPRDSLRVRTNSITSIDGKDNLPIARVNTSDGDTSPIVSFVQPKSSSLKGTATSSSSRGPDSRADLMRH